MTQNGKPFQINSELKQLWLNALPKPKVLSLKDRLKLWLNPSAVKEMAKPLRKENLEQESNSFFEELEEQDREQENRDLEEIEEEFPEDW